MLPRDESTALGDTPLSIARTWSGLWYAGGVLFWLTLVALAVWVAYDGVLLILPPPSPRWIAAYVVGSSSVWRPSLAQLVSWLSLGCLVGSGVYAAVRWLGAPHRLWISIAVAQTTLLFYGAVFNALFPVGTPAVAVADFVWGPLARALCVFAGLRVAVILSRARLLQSRLRA